MQEKVDLRRGDGNVTSDCEFLNNVTRRRICWRALELSWLDHLQGKRGCREFGTDYGTTVTASDYEVHGRTEELIQFVKIIRNHWIIRTARELNRCGYSTVIPSIEYSHSESQNNTNHDHYQLSTLLPGGIQINGLPGE